MRQHVHWLLALVAGLLLNPGNERTQAGEPTTPHRRIELVAGAADSNSTPQGAELREPFTVGTDAAGSRFIGELKGGRILQLTADGKMSVFAGTGEAGFRGDGESCTSAQFNGMHHLLVAPNGDIWVADTWNQRIRCIDAKTRVITTIAGSGKKGYSGDGGAAVSADCGGIYSLALDRVCNRLVFADLDNRRVRAVDLTDKRIHTIAGNGTRGKPTDNGLAAECPLLDPRAVACDSKGNVYVLERGGHALRVVDRAGRIRTVAGTGKSGPTVDDVPALQATLNGPKHVWVDDRDDVLIADAENHTIRKLIVQENRVIRVAGTGRKGTDGLGGPPERADLNRPHGVFVDDRGTLYIADSENHRVLKVDRYSAK